MVEVGNRKLYKHLSAVDPGSQVPSGEWSRGTILPSQGWTGQRGPPEPSPGSSTGSTISKRSREQMTMSTRRRNPTEVMLDLPGTFSSTQMHLFLKSPLKAETGGSLQRGGL